MKISKNKKLLLLAITLATVLILTSAVNATNTTDHNTDHTLSEKTSTPANSEIKETTINKEKIKTSKNKVEEKTIQKENKTQKQTKKDPVTIDGITYTNVIENQIITEAVTYNENTYINNSTFSYHDEYPGLWFDGNKKSIINNSYINTYLLALTGELKIHNSTLNDLFYSGDAKVYIDDTVTLGDNFYLLDYPYGPIYTNNPALIEKLEQYNIKYLPIPKYDLSGDLEITNENINTTLDIPITGNITIINSNVTAKIINRGTLTIQSTTLNNTLENMGTTYISEDTILGENYNIINYGTVIYLKYDGNKEINNENITKDITIPITGNITLTNCQINAKITNNGNLTLIYSFMSNNDLINNGKIIITNSTLNQTNITNANEADLFIINSTSYDSLSGNPGGKTVEIYNTNFIGKGFAGTKTINCTYINGTTVHASGDVINCSFINNTRTQTDNKVNNGGALGVNNARIINCVFINNGLITTDSTATSSLGALGGSGGAISGNNLNINNCTFDSNYAQTKSSWILYQGGGAISGNNLNINNSTFKNNYVISPQGTIINGSTYFTVFETGMGGAILATGIATITNNQFINNSASINGSAIYLTGGTNKLHTITNNRFQDNNQAVETIYIRNYFEDIENKKLIYFDTPTNITDNTYSNNSIGFKTLTLNGPNKAYAGDQITINLDIELEHPEFYDEDILEQTQYEWYINGETSTNKETEKTLTVENNNIISYVKPTITNSRTNIYSLTPTILNDIIITPENINQYLLLGELIVSPNSKLIFQGEFTDIGEICNNKNEVFFDGTQATFTNTYFTIEAHNNTIQNMNIKNTNTNPYTIKISGDDNTITNNTITTTNNQGLTAAIYNNNHNNNQINYNTLIVSGPALSTTSQSGATISNTQAILSIGGQNNQINYNTISVTNSTNPELAEFSTIEAITAPKGTKNTISYNNIQCTGARFNYGINLLNNVQENEISYNNITVTGYRYADGIQVGDGANNNIITYNNLNITCLNTTPVDEAAITYGIIITSQGGQTSNNNTITQNNIQLKGIVNYGIEIYTATNTTITTNNITLTGAKSTGIGYAHSPNSTVTQNTINTNDDSSIPINSVTEELQPDNTGIRIQQDSDNILIEDNTIQTYDKQGKDTCINIESNNITVKNNNLTSSNKVGDNTITTTQPDTTTIEDNNAIEQNSTTQTTTEDLTIGDSTALTAQFYDDTYTPAGDGKAIFRVNGKTLRDNQGNVIYADVINGRAELPNVNITQEWTKESTTIQAIYIGDDNNAPITTTPTTVTVTKPEATIILDAPTEATPGQEITLKATVTDGENNITSGRVAFKLNGKTLKDPKTGKALYAEVRDGVATITYTIPEKTKAKEYTLTAVFTDTKYDRVEAESKLNVVKA